MYKCSCGYQTETGNAFSVHFKHHKGDDHKRLGWVDPDTGAIFSTKPRKKQGPAPESIQQLGQQPGTSFDPKGEPTGGKAPEWLVIGTFRMPFADWGYSSTMALLIVAETYEQAKREYGFEGKVGDFMANLCQAFRILKGWDVIGGGYPEYVQINQEEVVISGKVPREAS